MEQLQSFIGQINSYAWGVPMLILILGTGLFLSVGLKIMTILRIPFAFRLLWQGRIPNDEAGEISPFNALMTSLSATIGTGNIAGVATAIFLGGPGAVFWMWVTAMVGMATKYAEAVCAVKFRETDENGNFVGGPMYYIKNGMGEKWKWLATLFAIFAAIAGFGIGNTVQSNSVADALQSNFGLPPIATGVIIMVLVGLVLIGGLQSISRVAGRLVPAMATLYILASLIVIFMHIDALPHAIGLIFTHAFTPSAATGGFAGAAVWAAIRFGVARGVFSNEAGLGSAPIAHAAAKSKGPVSQGLVAMLGTFIDTIIVCSFTAFAIIATGVWTSGETGASLTSLAFEDAMPGAGGAIIAIALSVFAFTTILGWSYYCERSLQYLFGVKVITPFRVLWSIAALIGAVLTLDFVWLLADTLNALMAIPNLIALIVLSPVVFSVTKEFFDSRGKCENNPF